MTKRTGAELVLDAAAVYRATVLLQQDTIPPLPRVRAWLMDRYGAKPIGQLIDCPWCLSVWLAGGAVLARRVAPRLWDVLARVLASSAAAGVMSAWLESLEPPQEVRVVDRASEEFTRLTEERELRLE